MLLLIRSWLVNSFWAVQTLSPNGQAWARRGTWIWGLTLLVACLFPSKEIPKVDVPFADKWVHFVLFGGQTLLALASLKTPDRKSILRVAVGCILFGVAIEVLQGITHPWLHRAFEVMDMIADAVGVLIGVLLFILAQKIFFKKPFPNS